MPPKKLHPPRLRRFGRAERAGESAVRVTVVPGGMVRIDDPHASVVNVVPARPLDVEPLYGVR